MKINKKKGNSIWFGYKDEENGECEFLIRPLPYSSLKIDQEKVMEGLLESFKYCLSDWKGIVDIDDVELECNEINKQFIFDFYDEIREFIFEKARELSRKNDVELKN